MSLKSCLKSLTDANASRHRTIKGLKRVKRSVKAKKDIRMATHKLAIWFDTTISFGLMSKGF